MKLIVKILISAVAAVILLLATLLFSGQHFCLPGIVDKGPGTAGCFYSE